jgi:hypothetical protein
MSSRTETSHQMMRQQCRDSFPLYVQYLHMQEKGNELKAPVTITVPKEEAEKLFRQAEK